MIYIFLAQNYGDSEKEPDCSLELTSVWHIRFIQKNELIFIFFKLSYIYRKIRLIVKCPAAYDWFHKI